ncbi:MAG: hypothetical protein JNJ60_09860 [Rhodocyclaceae bacterium]|nr:hypothetical protein [Rhodocyclaceae bacterium]
MPGAASVRAGNIYLSSECCAACLAGVESVAVLERDGKLMVVPLAAGSAGGLLLKRRNARGDRVIHAQEIFRRCGYRESFEECPISICWSAELAALLLDGIPGSPGQLQT